MRIAAVVVSYQPREHIRFLVRALLPQVWRIVIVDNGSSREHACLLDQLTCADVCLMPLDRNYGIGYAHNRGIAWAKSNDATHVLLLDQDSIPQQDMVTNLLSAEKALLKQSLQVGALGPVFQDVHTNKAWPFYRLSRLGVHPHECPDSSQTLESTVIPCDFLISSGTLIRLSVLESVGVMNETYFLEHVDTEWSLRARSRGYRLFGVCQARMQHSLGDDVVKAPLSDKGTQLYEPYRHYYLFRNALLLAREKYALLPWKLNETRRLFLRLLFFSLIVPPRWKRFKMMLLGVWHGLRGKSGPLVV